MIHPDTEVRFINPEKGYGLVATKFIPKGTITWVQDDLIAYLLKMKLPIWILLSKNIWTLTHLPIKMAIV